VDVVVDPEGPVNDVVPPPPSRPYVNRRSP
jgi:hypothetical protein